LVKRSDISTSVGADDAEIYNSLLIQFQMLISYLSNELKSDYLKALSEQANQALSESYDYTGAFNRLRGYIRGLQAAYDDGMLSNLSIQIEDEVVSDYLGQASNLLSEGKQGQYEHVPAAVLTGAILEDALRRLCSRQQPPIPTSKPTGQPHTMMTLVENLKKAGLFNELKASRLRAWVHIRNKAAHGKFSEFDRKDVEEMLIGVKNFLQDYP
ncbi:MAG: hypothetical protein AAF846_23565, partial [Chloroflexota bacterium]